MKKGQKIFSLISKIREGSNKLIIEELKKNDIEGLVPSHGSILIQLYRNDNLCMKEIAKLVGKDKSTITALVNKLVKLGYVEKIKDDEDSRITHLKLTEKGWAIENTFYSISEDLITRVYDGFDDEETESIILSLSKILEKI